MRKFKPNPTPSQGSRNVFCPYYSHCLDTVIKNSWITWHCHRCREQFNHQAEPEFALTVNHSIAYYELAGEV